MQVRPAMKAFVSQQLPGEPPPPATTATIGGGGGNGGGGGGGGSHRNSASNHLTGQQAKGPMMSPSLPGQSNSMGFPVAAPRSSRGRSQQTKIGPNSAPSAVAAAGGSNSSLTQVGVHHGSPAKGGGGGGGGGGSRMMMQHHHPQHQHLHPPNLSGSETDISTSNENLTQEERMMLRHMEREEPQGEETGNDPALAAAFHVHHHGQGHGHQLPRGLDPHQQQMLAHRQQQQQQLAAAAGRVSGPTIPGLPPGAVPVFPRSPGGGVIDPLVQRTSVQEELMAAKMAAGRGGGMPPQGVGGPILPPGGLSGPIVTPRLSTPTAPAQLLESSLMGGKLNPSVYGHPGFGGDPVLLKMGNSGNSAAGNATGLGAYPLTVLGGRKENVEMTSSGAFFDPKAVTGGGGRGGGGGGGAGGTGGRTGKKGTAQGGAGPAAAGGSDMISQLTREMKLQQQQQLSASVEGSALTGSSELSSNNSGSTQQLLRGGGGGGGGGSNNGSTQQLKTSSSGVTAAAATAKTSAPITSSSSAISNNPAARTTSISSSSGYRSDNSIGFEAKDLSVAPGMAGGLGGNHPAAAAGAGTAPVSVGLTGSNPTLTEVKYQQRHRNSIPSVTTLGIPGIGFPEDDPTSESVRARGGIGSGAAAKKSLLGGGAGGSSAAGLAALSRSQPDLSGIEQQHLQMGGGGGHSPLPPPLGGGLLGQHGLLSASGGGLDLLGRTGPSGVSGIGHPHGGGGGGPGHPQFNPMGGPSAIAQALQEGDLEKTVELLQEENRVLRCDLEDLSRRVSRVSALEQEMAKIQAAYQNLLRHSEKREALEKAARQKLQSVIVNLTEVNKEVTDRHEAVMAQLLSGDPKNQNIPGLDSILRGEILRKDNLIGQLMNQNKMLMATKERQDVEVRAQQETLEEQRSHIQILDTALSNAQAQLLRLEEENRVKESYAERVKQMTKSLEQLQAASEKREAMEKKLRMKLEEELRELRDQQQMHDQLHPGADDRGGGRSRRTSGRGGEGSGPVESGALLDLRRRLNEQEEKIIRLESERTQWEQRYLEETAMRQVAIDAAAIPKDARIAALERQGAESEKLIAEARSIKMRSFEEAQESQRKVAEMENVVKTLETTLTEQAAMIRIFQSNQSASAIDTALTDAAAATATAAAAAVEPTSPTHQLLQMHQRQLSASYLHHSSPLFQQGAAAPRPRFSVSAASTPTHPHHHHVRHHLNPSSPAASAAIVDYLRNTAAAVSPSSLARSRSPSAGLNVSHADILHANLIHDSGVGGIAAATSPLHSKALSLATAPTPQLSIFTGGGVGGSLHLNQSRQLHLLRRSATPTADLMRGDAGAGAMTLPSALASAAQQQRRDSAPGDVLAMATTAATAAAVSPGTTLINTADLYKIPTPGGGTIPAAAAAAPHSDNIRSNRSASSGPTASGRRGQLHLFQQQQQQQQQRQLTTSAAAAAGRATSASGSPASALISTTASAAAAAAAATAANTAALGRSPAPTTSSTASSIHKAVHGDAGANGASGGGGGLLRDTLINRSPVKMFVGEPTPVPHHVPAPAPSAPSTTAVMMDDSVDSIMGPMSSTLRIDGSGGGAGGGGGGGDPNETNFDDRPYMEVWRI